MLWLFSASRVFHGTMLLMQNKRSEARCLEALYTSEGLCSHLRTGGRLLVIVLLFLPALWPLLRTTALPCTHDNPLHYYRITAMREALRQGWLFARWVPNLALGYGYPFFNFREPLPYLLGEVLYVVGVPLPLVLGLIYALSLVAAAWGAYVLADTLFGGWAGWVAAVAYGLGPYLLLDALRRGNMPESVALALLPWLLVSFRRLIFHAGLRPFMSSVLLLAALFLSHNISSLLFAPFLGGYVVLLVVLRFLGKMSVRDFTQPPAVRRGSPDRGARVSVVVKRVPTQPRQSLWAFVAVALAVMITAWFWMPALLEQDTVQLHLSRTTRNNDFHYNFLTWGEMVGQGPVPHDPNFLNPPMRIYLGLARAVLMAVGVLVACWPSKRVSVGDLTQPISRDYSSFIIHHSSLESMFFALVALGYLWMSTEASVWVWEAVPLLAFVQFPWRLVGRALFPASLLAGAAFGERGMGWVKSIVGRMLNVKRETSNVKREASNYATPATAGTGSLFPIATVALLVLLAWPQTYPPKGMCAMAPYPALDDVYAFEQSGWMGVDPEGSYFPVWVEQHPTDMKLAEAFVRGETPARLDPQALPEDARVVSAHYRPLRASVVVETSRAFQARWLGFYYPGWRVWVDDKPVVVGPEEDTGLLTFPVPQGRHEVRVRFGTTPLRTTAGMIACLGLLAFVAVCALGLGGLKVASRKGSGSSDPGRAKLGVLRLAVMAVLAVVLLFLKVFVVDRGFTPLHHVRLTDGSLPEVKVPLRQPFAGGLTLLGYEIPDAPMPGDGELQVDLLWQARERPPAEYRTSVLLVGQDGQRWSPDGTLRPRGYEPTPPTTMWQPGRYAYDPHIVQPVAGAPPGDYDVVVSLFDKATLTPLSVLGPEGSPLGPDLTLGSVTVTRPQQPLALRALDLSQDAELQPCGALGLWTMTADRDLAAPGEVVGLRWVWEALADPSEALSVTLTLERETGGDGTRTTYSAVRTWPLPPVASWWPTDRWQAGDRWVGRPVIRLPGGLESGVYRLLTSIDPLNCGALGYVTLEVVAPERHWEVPADLISSDVLFNDEVRLAGYAVETDEAAARPDVIRVHLAWQALTEMETSYRVFVHVRRADGQVVAQSDGEPVNWTRPTTGWAVGEVVSEVREIPLPQDLPPGTYSLYVGLYKMDTRHPSAGTRLRTSDGADAWPLAEVVIP